MESEHESPSADRIYCVFRFDVSNVRRTEQRACRKKVSENKHGQMDAVKRYNQCHSGHFSVDDSSLVKEMFAKQKGNSTTFHSD